MNIYDSVFDEIIKVPSGKVSTYKIIAQKIGIKSYRLVGQILKTNQNSPDVPCHRVIKSNGEVGGFFGKNENIDKIRLLKKEGIKIENNKVIDFEKILYR